MRKKISALVVAAVAAGTIFVGAAPALAACPPETDGPCCNEGAIPALYRKLTGEELIHCPW